MTLSLMRYAIHTVADNPSHEAFWRAVEAMLTQEQLQRLGDGGDIRKNTWLKTATRPAAQNPWEKEPDPNDIDLVIFADDAAVDGLTMDKKLTLASLINREETRRSFGLDVLFCPASNIELRSYWRGWYGYDRAENPKGIAKIVVSP
jgi:hypothetical protein